MPRGGGKSAEDDAGKATEAATSLVMINLLWELMRALIDQQKVEMTVHRKEMAALLHKATEAEEGAKVRGPKPTLQKLSTDADIEDFLSTESGGTARVATGRVGCTASWSFVEEGYGSLHQSKRR